MSNQGTASQGIQCGLDKKVTFDVRRSPYRHGRYLVSSASGKVHSHPQAWSVSERVHIPNTHDASGVPCPRWMPCILFYRAYIATEPSSIHSCSGSKFSGLTWYIAARLDTPVEMTVKERNRYIDRPRRVNRTAFSYSIQPWPGHP